jgi:hypothetical protein
VPGQDQGISETQYVDPISTIKAENLSQEDKNKLMNITNLQNMIQISQSTVNTFKASENKVEHNLKRELTDREKIERDMKKWNKKEQKKVFRYS